MIVFAYFIFIIYFLCIQCIRINEYTVLCACGMHCPFNASVPVAYNYIHYHTHKYIYLHSCTYYTTLLSHTYTHTYILYTALFYAPYYPILHHIHSFPRRPWIDVVSKGDIPIPEHIRSQLPTNYISISVVNGYNMELLKKEIENMLFNLRDILMERGV